MFVDLEDSTALGERLDPEDLLEMLQAYRAFCDAAVNRFGGSVVRYVGDGILAYFGHPSAHENDPERAVRAALEIAGGISALITPAQMPLSVRIGIATGTAVVGDLDPGGGTDHAEATGSVLNLAARLQTLARRNGIVIGEHTHSRVQPLFECEPLGSVELRGFPTPRVPWRVIGEKPHRGLAAPARLTGLHGREAELSVLQGMLNQAAAGNGQAALVMGEPGIGKSRLIEHLIAHHLPAGMRVSHLATTPFDENRPLGPVIDHVRIVSGLEPEDTPPVARRKIAYIVAGTTEQRKRALPVFARLLGFPLEGPDQASLSPEQVRDQTVAVLAEQILAIATRQPLCLIVEDLHWLDPSTRELLEAILPRVAGAPLALLLTGRDGVNLDWLGSDVMVLRLDRLAQSEVADMLNELFGVTRPLPALLEQVVHRTDGVPLFVEEVARVLLERSGESTELIDFVPESLQESLISRLDRSGPGKQLAQVAAVAGRSVRRDVLARACGLAPEGLEPSLSLLVEAGILERHTRLRVEIVSFSHALVREAAYSSLLRGRRRELHRRMARAIRESDPAAAARDPDVLAHHLMEGGLAEEAAPLWLEAARRSLARSALTEATRILRRALAALEALPPAKSIIDLRIQVSVLLGPALSGLTGPNSAETRAHYAKAQELCQQLPEDPAHFPIYWGWWRLDMKVDRASALLSRAVTGNDPGLMLQAHHCNWASHLNAGAFERCCEHVQAGLALYASGDFSHHARIYGNHDPKVCAHGARAQAWWMQGRLRSAMADEAEALAWAERTRHLGSRVHAKGLTLLHRVYRRDYQEVFDRAGELMAFTAEHGVADHGAAGLVFQGWVIATQRDAHAGLRMIEEGMARQKITATDEDYSVYLCLLAEALVAAGQAERAVELLIRERAAFQENGFGIWLPELLRVTGEAVLAADPAAAARAWSLLSEAAELAATQNVPMLGLRIAVSQARLAARLQEQADHIDRLRSALRAIPEPDQSPDIVESERFLACPTPS